MVRSDRSPQPARERNSRCARRFSVDTTRIPSLPSESHYANREDPAGDGRRMLAERPPALSRHRSARAHPRRKPRRRRAVRVRGAGARRPRPPGALLAGAATVRTAALAQGDRRRGTDRGSSRAPGSRAAPRGAAPAAAHLRTRLAPARLGARPDRGAGAAAPAGALREALGDGDRRRQGRARNPLAAQLDLPELRPAPGAGAPHARPAGGAAAALLPRARGGGRAPQRDRRELSGPRATRGRRAPGDPRRGVPPRVRRRGRRRKCPARDRRRNRVSRAPRDPAGQPAAAAPRAAQPLRELARRDEGRRRDHRLHRGLPGRLPDHGERHRRGDSARGPLAPLDALHHAQGERQRPRALPGPRDPAAPRRAARDPEHPGRGHLASSSRCPYA